MFIRIFSISSLANPPEARIGLCADKYSKKEKQQAAEVIFNCGSTQTFIHLSSKKYADALLPYIKTFYIHKTPVGYGKEKEDDNYYQYHICVNTSSHYEAEDEAEKEPAVDLTAIVAEVERRFPKSKKTLEFLKEQIEV